jgi:glycosyltransferase involved in cell wall biosynthesis
MTANRSTTPLLSILITTYNRSFFLRQCLESIKTSLLNSRYFSNVEIVLLNNGCTDDTIKIIDQFKDVLPLKVFQEISTIGFVNGVLKCIDSAKGCYCWFLGDDDYIALDNLDILIDYIEKNIPDILLLNHYFYIFRDGKMTFLKKDNNGYLMRNPKDCYADYSDYILAARHNNAFFTHIAPVIFKRILWHRYFSMEAMEKHDRSHSPHTHVLLSLLKNSRNICYFPKQALALCFGAPQENNRGEWTLTEEGRYTLFEMSVIFLPNIFMDVFKEKNLVRHFTDIMLKNNVLVILLGSKVRGNFPSAFYIKLFRLLYRHYKTHPFFWYGIMPVFLTPKFIFLWLYRLFINK